MFRCHFTHNTPITRSVFYQNYLLIFYPRSDSFSNWTRKGRGGGYAFSCIAQTAFEWKTLSREKKPKQTNKACHVTIFSWVAKLHFLPLANSTNLQMNNEHSFYYFCLWNCWILFVECTIRQGCNSKIKSSFLCILKTLFRYGYLHNIEIVSTNARERI